MTCETRPLPAGRGLHDSAGRGDAIAREPSRRPARGFVYICGDSRRHEFLEEPCGLRMRRSFRTGTRVPRLFRPAWIGISFSLARVHPVPVFPREACSIRTLLRAVPAEHFSIAARRYRILPAPASTPPAE